MNEKNEINVFLINQCQQRVQSQRNSIHCAKLKSVNLSILNSQANKNIVMQNISFFLIFDVSLIYLCELSKTKTKLFPIIFKNIIIQLKCNRIDLHTLSSSSVSTRNVTNSPNLIRDIKHTLKIGECLLNINWLYRNP